MPDRLVGREVTQAALAELARQRKRSRRLLEVCGVFLCIAAAIGVGMMAMIVLDYRAETRAANAELDEDRDIRECRNAYTGVRDSALADMLSKATELDGTTAQANAGIIIATTAAEGPDFDYQAVADDLLAQRLELFSSTDAYVKAAAARRAYDEAGSPLPCEIPTSRSPVTADD